MAQGDQQKVPGFQKKQAKSTLLNQETSFRKRGFDFLAAAGTNNTPLRDLMFRSAKDWHRFSRAWLDQALPTPMPAPRPKHDNYRYTVELPNPDDFQFILAGDTGINSPGELMVSSAISRQDCFPSDFLLLLGDVIYPAGSETDYRYGLLEAFKHYKKPILAIPGNHDWYDRLNAYERFFMSGNFKTYYAKAYDWQCPKLPNWFYYMDLGSSLRVLCLDTGLSGELKENRAAQLDWLDEVLADSQEKLLLVMMHHPMYSLANRQYDRELRKLLEERFQKAGVRAIISGHHHNYQRHTVEGIDHIVAGGGGATLQQLPKSRRIRRAGAPDIVLEKASHPGWDTHHSFLHCHWKNGELRCNAWSAHALPPEERILLDSFTIREGRLAESLPVWGNDRQLAR